MARLFLRFFLGGETRCPLAHRSAAKTAQRVGKRTRLPPDICAFGDYCHRLRKPSPTSLRIKLQRVERLRRPRGEADPPSTATSHATRVPLQRWGRFTRTALRRLRSITPTLYGNDHITKQIAQMGFSVCCGERLAGYQYRFDDLLSQVAASP